MASVDFSMKTDATGTILSFTLRAENPQTRAQEPVDFSTYQFVKITLQQDGIAPAISGETCDMDPDQDANTGQGTFSFGSHATGLPGGDYNLEWHALDSAGRDFYWPTDSDEPYGKVLVEEHLG